MAKENLKTHNSIFTYSSDFMLYKLSENHPFNPIRTKITYDLLKSINSIDETEILTPRLATEKELELGHSKEYIDIVKSIEHTDINKNTLNNYGLGNEDNPVFKNIHKAGLTIVGATLSAVENVLNCKYEHALNLSGGLHHALYGKASGFCIYNDIVIAIKYIQKYYNKRVLYVDSDAHHGDAVQWAFYDDPLVCTLSIHETGRYLFPGTGNIIERGSGKGYGYTFNVPLDAFTEDDSWLEAYKTSFEEVVEYFKPDVIITQNGTDGHCFDPLTHLSLTMNTYKYIPKLAHKIAHDYCDGKWIALGGGGYDILRVVPRAWSYIWLEMINWKDDLIDIPISWLNKWQKYSKVEIPTTWDDPKDMYEPIPRKNEITQKNLLTLKNTLYTISKKHIGNKFLQQP
ncbi:MAG: acetoin utilization protein AcuC [Eubacteriaceae bacterium]